LQEDITTLKNNMNMSSNKGLPSPGEEDLSYISGDERDFNEINNDNPLHRRNEI
jgi:hypothetical protein